MRQSLAWQLSHETHPGRKHNSSANRRAVIIIKDIKARAISERLLFIIIYTFLGTGIVKKKKDKKRISKHRLPIYYVLDGRSDDLCPRFI